MVTTAVGERARGCGCGRSYRWWRYRASITRVAHRCGHHGLPREITRVFRRPIRKPVTRPHLVINIDSGGPPNVWRHPVGVLLPLSVIMVMTGVAATVEFRYGTIRTTFEVVPDRLSAPPAKIALVACPLAGELVLSFARTVVGPTRRGVVGPTRRGVVGPTRRGQPGDLVSAAADADGPSVTRSEPDDGTPVARRH